MVEKYKEKVEYMIKRREMSSKECYCDVNKGVPMSNNICPMKIIIKYHGTSYHDLQSNKDAEHHRCAS